MYPLPMVYEKPSLENRNAPEKRYSKRQENYVVDKHSHPMWHHNVSTLVLNERQGCGDGSNSPYLKECEKACNLQEARVSIKKERKFW